MQLDQLLTQVGKTDQANSSGDAGARDSGGQLDFLQLLTTVPSAHSQPDPQPLADDGIDLPEQGTDLPPAHNVSLTAERDTLPGPSRRELAPPLAELTRAIRDEIPLAQGLTPASRLDAPPGPVQLTPVNTRDMHGTAVRNSLRHAQADSRIAWDGSIGRLQADPGSQPDAGPRGQPSLVAQRVPPEMLVDGERRLNIGIDLAQARVAPVAGRFGDAIARAPTEHGEVTRSGAGQALVATRTDPAIQHRVDTTVIAAARSDVDATPAATARSLRNDAALPTPLPPSAAPLAPAATASALPNGASIDKSLPPLPVKLMPAAPENSVRNDASTDKSLPPLPVKLMPAPTERALRIDAILDKPLPPPAVGPTPAASENGVRVEVAVDKPLPLPTVAAMPTAATVAATGDSIANRGASGLPVLDIPTPVTDPEWREAVGSRITMLAGRNIGSAELRLSPADLGPVQVQISVDDNVAKITFSATHSLTREQLELTLPRLREMLAEQGVTLGGASVNERHAGGQSDGHDGAGGNDIEPLDTDSPSESIETIAVPVRNDSGPGRVDTYA